MIDPKDMLEMLDSAPWQTPPTPANDGTMTVMQYFMSGESL